MGEALSQTSCPEGTVEMVIANVGTPAERARPRSSARTSAPNTGYLRLAFTDPEKRKLSQAELAREGARAS